jgi:citrate lyase subunit beta/citryl-CoA lyase
MINNSTSEGADAIILDLEDGCPMAEKETGRVFARDSISMLKQHGLEVFVRVNSMEAGLTGIDIGYVVMPGLDGIMLAKTEAQEDVKALDSLLKEQEKKKGMASGSVQIMALLETPKGILNIREIIAASPRMVAVGFGAGDFSREMGAGMGVTKLSPDEYFPMILHARSSIAMAARAAGVQAIDTPYFGLVIDLDGLRRESEKVKLLGFSGKQLTHPRHVEVANQVFTPARADVEYAKKVVEAYQEARSKGLGATTLGGKMIDFGSFKRAESLLSSSRAVEEKEKRQAASH